LKFKNEKLLVQFLDKNNEFERDIIMFFLMEEQVMLMLENEEYIQLLIKLEYQGEETEISI
jgi:hypothetical protein